MPIHPQLENWVLTLEIHGCTAVHSPPQIWPGRRGVQGSCQDSEKPCLELSLLAEIEQMNGKYMSFMLPTAISLSGKESALCVWKELN